MESGIACPVPAAQDSASSAALDITVDNTAPAMSLTSATAPVNSPPVAMDAPEAAAIMKKYRARIGQMLEPKRESDGGRAGR